MILDEPIGYLQQYCVTRDQSFLDKALLRIQQELSDPELQETTIHLDKIPLYKAERLIMSGQGVRVPDAEFTNKRDFQLNRLDAKIEEGKLVRLYSQVPSESEDIETFDPHAACLIAKVLSYQGDTLILTAGIPLSGEQR